MEVNLKAEPEEIKLDTARTALIVVDMQNSFCKKGGMMDFFGKLDEDMTKRVIATNIKIIEACRSAGIKIVYLRMCYKADLSDAGGPESPNYWKEGLLAAMRKNPDLKGRFMIANTRDSEIIDELRPLPEETIINKSRYSGFVNTELDAVLKAGKIKHLVFIGLFTNVCVESTLRDAYFHEFFPVLVGDGCGNTGPDFTQAAAIWTISNVFGWVTTTAEVISALGK